MVRLATIDRFPARGTTEHICRACTCVEGVATQGGMSPGWLDTIAPRSFCLILDYRPPGYLGRWRNDSWIMKARSMHHRQFGATDELTGFRDDIQLDCSRSGHVSNSTENRVKKKRVAVNEILKGLQQEYPDVTCALDHQDPLQLLVATILSAQCTDARVNMVTPALFARYPTAADFANARLPDLERLIHSTGFFRNKAKNLTAAGQRLL